MEKYKAVFLAVVMAVVVSTQVIAGPYHWGFGMQYLAVIEKDAVSTRLVVYEAPLRAKDAIWISRWVDESPRYSQVREGCLAVGNFWPGKFGKDYVVVVEQRNDGLKLVLLEPPEVFGTMPWKAIESADISNLPVPVALATGDILNRNRDSLLILGKAPGGFSIHIANPGRTPDEGLSLTEQAIPVPRKYNDITGFTCGDFWGEGKDYIAFTYPQGSGTGIDIYEYSNFELKPVVTDHAGNLPAISRSGLIGADFVKDGFDTLTLIPISPDAPLEVRTSPAKSPDYKYSPGPVYTGRGYSGQWMPGRGGTESIISMRGVREIPGRQAPVIASAAGRLFGYVATNLTEQQRDENGYDPRPDAEISFAHRFPLYPLLEGEPNYGWPLKGEEFGYEINLKNNGQTAIPAGSATINVWINTPYRNADTHPATRNKPDYILKVNQELPPFNPLKPEYVVVKVTSKWLYDLIPAGPNAKWKKLDLSKGEFWFVVSMECEGDMNQRNNRFETAINSWSFHPNFRKTASLADRLPTVKGDPPSKEYLSRKLADSITCMYERTRTTDNRDVLQRVHFDSYSIGWPHDQPDPNRAWREVQRYYEGWRELDGWWGVNQRWERFDWSDGEAELHEAGHLYHPMGDLYQYHLHPVWTSGAKLPDGSPVQFRTSCWAPDSFSTGHAVLGYPTGEYVAKYLAGSRGWGHLPWYDYAPDKVYIRVLDRKGNPVPDAKLTLWPYGSSTPLASGVTGRDGRWDTGHPKNPPYNINKFGLKEYRGYLMDAFAQIVTVELPGYQDASVWGAENETAYGKYTLFYNAIVNEKEWTWDFRTNYLADAPKPSFTVDAAIKGREAQLGITGRRNVVYRIYRRWEPTYNRVLIGQYASPGESFTITMNMGETDSHSSNHSRAIYEVTEIIDGQESLPRSVQCTALANVTGISAVRDGRTVVSTNTGIANPWAVICRGTEPYIELFYHFRFGHTGMKIVESRTTPGKYYATLSFSDMTPDYRFDVIDPLPEGKAGYDVRNHLGSFDAGDATFVEPFSITIRNPRNAPAVSTGDVVRSGNRSARILDIRGDTIILDKSIFQENRSSGRCTADRLAGIPGSRAELRELKDARGLDTVLLENKEFIVIADTGNNRVAIWDDNTRYITHIENEGFRPTAVSAHPSIPGAFFILDRLPDRNSRLYLFGFDGKTVKPAQGFPISIETGDYGNYEIGLAVASRAEGGILVAITDAEKNEVIEVLLQENKITATRKYNTVSGTVAGNKTLNNPSDAAYVLEGPNAGLYAVDGKDRVVKLR